MKKKGKKAVATSAAAVITAAGVMIAGAVETPSELLSAEEQSSVQTVHKTDAVLADGPDDMEEDTEEDKKQTGWRAAVRKKLLAMPLAVKILVILPLWLLGSAVIAAAGALWPLAAPVLSKVLYCVAILIAVFGTFILSAKTFFPNMPVKKLLNRRTIPCLLGGAAVMTAADYVLPLVWDGYKNVRSIVGAVLLGLVLAASLVSLLVRRARKRRPAPAPAASGTTITTASGESYTVHFPEDDK